MGRSLLSGGSRLGQRHSSTVLLAACALAFSLGFLLRPPPQKQFVREIGVVAGLERRLIRKADQTEEVEPGESGRGDSTGDSSLKQILEKIAPQKEVLAAVSNQALISKDGEHGMLRYWINGVRHSGVENFMVICLDDEVAEIMKKLNVPYWRKDPKKTADKANSNHAISALKFQLVKEFLILGYSVLLSDVDILTLRNPFEHMHRDEDVEGLSDGYDPPTAYGYDDVFDDYTMGWSRYAHTIRIFVLNSGLFYIRPNERTVKLMDRITERLMREKVWDQQAYNEEIFFPTHNGYNGSHVTVRIMDIYDFVNSKTLFRTMRYEPQFQDHTPVMVHVNYHPDKYQRMQDIWKRYVDGEKNALDKYPVGSCKEGECPH